MRPGLMTFAIALFVLSWGWNAEAQLQPPPRPIVHRTLEIEGLALGGSVSAIAPFFGATGGSADISFNMEVPVAHTVSFRADVGLADWDGEGVTRLASGADRIALARGTFVIVGRPHKRPGQYLGAGLGVYRFDFGGQNTTVRRAVGGTMLGGVELPFSRKLVMGLELQGHFIDAESRGLPPGLSLIVGAAVRMQWRY